jgi:hypothetical protein
MIENKVNTLPCMPSEKFSAEPLSDCLTVFKLFNLEYLKSAEKIEDGLKENAATLQRVTRSKNAQVNKSSQLCAIYNKQLELVEEEDAFWLGLGSEVNEITNETIAGVQEVVRTGIARLESLRICSL